ncbi:MAG: ATP-grasp domain-containing protein, partial [Proteobacteria bacterium]|nr:ATP-grasp domain-containing protein [Pseudomonadota bacterium]
MFKRVLIANRGEIALRIIRACRELGVETVCVYSSADKGGPWLEQADRAICIGPGPSKESYLKIERIIAAAEVSHADAIHPGYGFLSENSHFAEVCRASGFEFIGPSPEAMHALGDKVNCKKLARKTGTPVFPGTEDAIEDIDEAVKVAAEIKYPVIVKARAGGGGRGMRIARNEAELRAGIESARQEAAAAFG